MGSSCYAHGSKKLLETVQEFLTQKGQGESTEISGSLCCNHCSAGPVAEIDDQLFTELSPEGIITLLSSNKNSGKKDE